MSKDQAHSAFSSRFEGMQFVVETETRARVYELEYLVAVILVSIARSNGHIARAETEKMLQLIGDYFHLRSSTSLALLTRAVEELAESNNLSNLLQGWSTVLTPSDKEDIAVMMLKVIDADGNRDADEMAMLHRAADIIEISVESLHRAFNRFFDGAEYQ